MWSASVHDLLAVRRNARALLVYLVIFFASSTRGTPSDSRDCRTSWGAEPDTDSNCWSNGADVLTRLAATAPIPRPSSQLQIRGNAAAKTTQCWIAGVMCSMKKRATGVESPSLPQFCRRLAQPSRKLGAPPATATGVRHRPETATTCSCTIQFRTVVAKVCADGHPWVSAFLTLRAERVWNGNCSSCRPYHRPVSEKTPSTRHLSVSDFSKPEANNSFSLRSANNANKLILLSVKRVEIRVGFSS
jgi:hypothetical protein